MNTYFNNVYTRQDPSSWPKAMRLTWYLIDHKECSNITINVTTLADAVDARSLNVSSVTTFRNGLSSDRALTHVGRSEKTPPKIKKNRKGVKEFSSFPRRFVIASPL